MRKKRKKTKHIGPLTYLKAPGPTLMLTEERCEYRPYDEASPCLNCMDMNLHCYECSHQRMDDEWPMPQTEELWEGC